MTPEVIRLGNDQRITKVSDEITPRGEVAARRKRGATRAAAESRGQGLVRLGLLGRTEGFSEAAIIKSSQVNTLPKAKSHAKDKRAKDRQ
jgi:hypothetical protein